jgi:hypothetical protein
LAFGHRFRLSIRARRSPLTLFVAPVGALIQDAIAPLLRLDCQPTNFETNIRAIDKAYSRTIEKQPGCVRPALCGSPTRRNKLSKPLTLARGRVERHGWHAKARL